MQQSLVVIVAVCDLLTAFDISALIDAGRIQTLALLMRLINCQASVRQIRAPRLCSGRIPSRSRLLRLAVSARN